MSPHLRASGAGADGDLLGWLGRAEEHPLIASSVFHYELELTHPFADGNGRIGRLWQTWKTQLAPAEQSAALDRASTEALLTTLENPPCPLAPDEASWQRTVSAGLTARVDELSLDDLLERIVRLSRELRGQLLHRLRELV